MTTAVVPPPGQGTLTSAFPTTENTVATSQGTTSGTYTDLATVGPAVTITVPASGRVIVTITCLIDNETQNGSDSSMSFALSGANTVAATNTMRIWQNGSSNVTGGGSGQLSASFLLTGLTAGSTTFTAKYRTNGGGNNIFFAARSLCVEPVDADVAVGGTAAFTTTENVVATSEGTTSATFTDLATSGPAVTVTVPASGRVKVSFYALCNNGSAPSTDCYTSFAITGANTLTAASNLLYVYYRQANVTNGFSAYNSTLLTGLTPGSTTFTMKYRSDGSNTSNWSNRRIRVEPVDRDKG